jgi:hypothetical protein
MPQPKKHPSVRQRRNVAAGAATLRVLEPDEVVVPPLPEVYNEKGEEVMWTSHAVRYWQTIWSSPMAPEYHKSDIEGLYRLVALVNAFWRKPSMALNGEIRLYEAQFGLNPLARRRLEWTIEGAEAAQDAGDDRRNRRNGERQAAEIPTGAPDPLTALA